MDIGAYEVGVFQRGLVEVESTTPDNEAADVDYSPVVKIKYNVDVEMLNTELITASSKHCVVG